MEENDVERLNIGDTAVYLPPQAVSYLFRECY